MDEVKKGAKNAVEKYLLRQEKEAAGPTRRNQKPEKEVEKACLEWMRARGWVVAIYESKSKFDPSRGRYISQTMKAGTADCMGNLPDGIECIVEFKAPGRLSSFASEKNMKQQLFLQRKIQTNCFAAVVDSVARLELIFKSWQQKRSAGDLYEARMYLLSMLPEARPKKEQGGLFD